MCLKRDIYKSLYIYSQEDQPKLKIKTQKCPPYQPTHLRHTTIIRRHHDDNHNIYFATNTPLTTTPKLESPVINTTPPISPPKNDDPSFKSTWLHRAWVATGCTTVLISLASAVIGSAKAHIWIGPILSGFIGYLFADLGSGVYHWVIDNYGDASTPVFGTQIDAFQCHHMRPWVITNLEFAYHIHVVALVITFTVFPVNLMFHDQPMVMGFVGIASMCILFSQQFHAWAHGTKGKLPSVVVALQDAGVLISRSKHAVHHRPPYNKNYCVVSGVWNRLLDEHKVFEALEMALFFLFGLRPRSWKEPNLDWTEEAGESLAMLSNDMTPSYN